MTARGQTNLLALGSALLLVTAALVVALGVAGGAFADARRDPVDRRLAVSLSERLVATDARATERANVLDRDAATALNASALRARYPALEGRAFRVRLDGDAIAAAGDASDGATIRRLVLVRNRTRATATPPPGNRTVRLPDRSPNATLRIEPPPTASVSAVRVDGRTVLRNRSGLVGSFEVALPRTERARMTFVGNGTLPPGSVRVAYHPATTTRAVLAVTVDA